MPPTYGQHIIMCYFMQAVHGVLTQDSDAFLYGATVVYRDLSTDQKVCGGYTSFLFSVTSVSLTSAFKCIIVTVLEKTTIPRKYTIYGTGLKCCYGHEIGTS